MFLIWYFQTRVFWQWLRLQAWFFLLFNITSAWEMPFAIPLYIQCILTRALHCVHSSLLTTRSIDFVVGTWWLPFLMEIGNFRSSFFDCRSSSCWFILLLNIAGNETFSFQMINVQVGERGANVSMRYAWVHQ